MNHYIPSMLLRLVMVLLLSSLSAKASGWEYSRDVIKIEIFDMEIGISEFKHISDKEDAQSGILFRKKGSNTWPARLGVSPMTLILILSVGLMFFILVLFFLVRKSKLKKK